MAQIEKKKAQESRISGHKFHKALQPYVLTMDQVRVFKTFEKSLKNELKIYLTTQNQLIINNYPIPSKENKKVVTIKDLGRRKQIITGHSEKRICARCGTEFYIRDGEVTGGECNYHSGKLYSDRTSHHYS